jgi:pescadillo protein
VVDCINAGKILLEEPYAQGATLPPHLSPFGEADGAYDPAAGLHRKMEDVDQEEESASEGEGDAEAVNTPPEQPSVAALIAAVNSPDAAALRAAELTAEVAGMDHGAFEKELGKSQRKLKAKEGLDEEPDDMNKMMMSNKQKKLYEKVKHSQKKRTLEVKLIDTTTSHLLTLVQRSTLQDRKKQIEKQKRHAEKKSQEG